MSTNMNDPGHFVSVEALTLIFDVERSTMYKMLRAQQLPCITVGKLRRVPAMALSRHIENLGMAAAGQGMALIRDAQQRAAGDETLAIDITPPPIDRTASTAIQVAAVDQNPTVLALERHNAKQAANHS